MGRAGRGGDQSVCVFLHKRGGRIPPEMRPYLKPDNPICLKKGMEQIFTLQDPDGEILIIQKRLQFFLLLLQAAWQCFAHSGLQHRGERHRLQCSLHWSWLVQLQQMPVVLSLLFLERAPAFKVYLRCCSKCSARCLKCPLKEQLGADQLLATILGLGDESYKSVKNLSKSTLHSDHSPH